GGVSVGGVDRAGDGAEVVDGVHAQGNDAAGQCGLFRLCVSGFLSVVFCLAVVVGHLGWRADGACCAYGVGHPRQAKNTTLKALYAEYALNAAGWVPHMIFLVAFIAHGLGQGLEVGAQYWVLFGIGATLGPLLAGVLA
nr:hypothetical protein [Tanacetum cinerariifolium]